MPNPRKIVFLTGTRADFGKLKPLISVVAEDPDFSYEIFATGMHLLARYGRTIIEIGKAGFENVFPFFNQDGTGQSTMESALANTLMGVSHYVRENEPDMLVVHGDRVEALAGAIAGALNNVLVCHIEGGEISGTIDEVVRHAVSKMSHLHLVSNDEAAHRLLRMGEREDAVYVVGSPDIDVMLSPGLPTPTEVRERYEIPFADFGILLYHPVTTELDRLGDRARGLVDAVLSSGRSFVVISPNNDHGAEIIEGELSRLSDPERFRHLKSMRFEYFLSLLKHAEVILGNSSAGIREAPVYGVPTINVGTRQTARFVYQSILDMDELDEDLAPAIAKPQGRFPPPTTLEMGKALNVFASS